MAVELEERTDPEVPTAWAESTAPDAGGPGGGIRGAGLSGRVLWSSLLAVVLVGGYALGYATRGDSGAEELRVELRSVRADARERAAAAQSEIDAATQRAETAEGQLADRESELAALETDLRAQQAELDRREDEIRASEQRIEQNTFGDGIWQVGVDFEAGLYRSDGGQGCYWALLSSANTGLSSIINNGGFSPNQTLQIDSPWFETSGCGEWTKIG